MKKILIALFFISIQVFAQSNWNTQIGILTANKTVNIDASMTVAQIQSLIDSQPKNLGGYILTFQFADGTYNLDAQLLLSYYYNGSINFQGNSTEGTTKYTTQAVVLNFASTNGIYINKTEAGITIKWLKISITTNSCINIFLSNKVWVYYCYLLGNSTAAGNGISANNVNVLFFSQCYFSNILNCVFAAYSPLVFSLSNSVTGTTPAVGLAADQGTTIGKYDSTQPAATTPEQATHGGVIR
jgi:hypothetical protein